MKIAYIISTLERCGPVNVLFDLVRFLSAENSIRVYTLATEPANSRETDFLQLGVRVECVFDSRLESFAMGSEKLEKAMRDFNPDVIHVHGFRATILCSGLQQPSLVTVHNCLYEDYRLTYGRFRARWMARTESAALKKFDMVIGCSESCSRVLHDVYDIDAHSIRNGVDQSVYSPLSVDEKRKIRSSLKIDTDSKVYISTGGCTERKGTLELIRSFNIWHQGHSHDVLHILGSGPLLDECRRVAGEGVTLHGFCEDVLPWLQASDVFVSNSCSEGMPLAVLEAMSCGCFALLSSITPHYEIAKVCPSNVRLVEFKDPSSFGLTEEQFSALNLGDLNELSSSLMSHRYYKAYSKVIESRGSK